LFLKFSNYINFNKTTLKYDFIRLHILKTQIQNINLKKIYNKKILKINNLKNIKITDIICFLNFNIKYELNNLNLIKSSIKLSIYNSNEDLNLLISDYKIICLKLKKYKNFIEYLQNKLNRLIIKNSTIRLIRVKKYLRIKIINSDIVKLLRYFMDLQINLLKNNIILNLNKNKSNKKIIEYLNTIKYLLIIKNLTFENIEYYNYSIKKNNFIINNANLKYLIDSSFYTKTASEIKNLIKYIKKKTNIIFEKKIKFLVFNII
jgi:hypothetical protein